MTAFITSFSPPLLLRHTASPALSHRRRRPPTVHPHLSLNPAPADKILEGPFDGQYGPFHITQSDVTGVQIYRAALLATSLTTALTTALALLKGPSLPPALYDTLYYLATATFGLSLTKIHIYLKPLHNLLKATWGLALASSLALSLSPLTSGLVTDVYAHPALLLAVGWQFVSLTGLFVKEAFCFGRLEALALIPLLPVLVGGHFLAVLNADVEGGLAVAFAALFLVFSIRKFQQPARDDLGDLSVFQHLASGGQL